MIHGENLILAINGEPLAASKSCSLSKSSSFIEVAPPTAGDWEAFVPSRKSWSMSSDCLLGTMDAYKTLDAVWKAGTALTIRFFNTEYDENETGTAYIDSLNLDASKGNLAKMSVGLKGSGPLSEYTGNAIQVNRQLLQSGKYYSLNSSVGNYIVSTASTGKIYMGTFAVNKRVKVKVTASRNDIFLSQDQRLVTLAQNLQPLEKRNYSVHLDEDGKIWIDAGIWYLVESNATYQYTSQFNIISI